jgi:hypothetical protein
MVEKQYEQIQAHYLSLFQNNPRTQRRFTETKISHEV